LPSWPPITTNPRLPPQARCQTPVASATLSAVRWRLGVPRAVEAAHLVHGAVRLAEDVAVDVEKALRVRDGLLARGGFDDRAAADAFLGLGERPVGDADLAVLEGDARPVQSHAAGLDQHTRLGHFLAELAERLEQLRIWRARGRVERYRGQHESH